MTITIKHPDIINREIYELTNNQIKNIAFYDDVLLYLATKGIKPLLRQIINENKKFYFIPQMNYLQNL
jgi:hypothetical protein